MLHGLMMQAPLAIASLIQHADRFHPDVEIVSRRVEGDIHRSTYRQAHRRARQLANALAALGVGRSDRVGTLAWNGYRHFELYFAVSGSGAVLHTLNPRLHPEQIAWIINHAGDRVLCFDLTFLPIVEAIAAHCPGVEHWVAMIDHERMPAAAKVPLHCYEALIDGQTDRLAWPQFDENLASSMCYTSGTTGNPKGVLYSHRSTLLHSYAAALPDALNLSSRDTILPVVPMFHVNAWGLPYVAPMVGAKLVFPGGQLDGKSLYELFESERVTVSAGVPTVWQGLLAHVESAGLRFSTMNRTVIGGSACPPAMLRLFQEKYGVQVLHAWGMTEMSPLGTVCSFKAKHDALGDEDRRALQAKQGRVIFGVDMKVVGEDGTDLPWDGRAFGNLLEEAQARGLLEFGRDEKSGAYVYRQGGSTPARPERVERIDMAVQSALQPPDPQSREVLQADDAQEPRREPRRRSRGGRRATQPQSMDSAEQPSSEPAAIEPPPLEQDEQPADPPFGMDQGAGAPKPCTRRPRKPAVKQAG